MSRYEKRPVIASGPRSAVAVGWDEIASRLSGLRVVVVEVYPGADVSELLRALRPDLVIHASDAFRPPPDDLGDDPVFARLTSTRLEDLLDRARAAAMRAQVAACDGRVVVAGQGASMVWPEGRVVYADMTRWEATLRLRASGGSYKQAFFVDWRIADAWKRSLWDRIGWVLDTVSDVPALVDADALWRALSGVSRRPFRLVPYFDPAPWGGHWMQSVCDVGHDQANLGWCFDCVPEENSLLLGFGEVEVEIPAIDLVFREPRALLGAAVHERFGAEFPIRFDFLDTMGGGNLSLQVHPSTGYIAREFGWPYTQDESYYLLDASPGAGVYLGLREGIDREALIADLRRGTAFDADRYVNRFPAQAHDHFLIPAGTIHCSGAGCMVLEISATPYLFTFKLWDWDRPGLDGRPRPTHVEHGVRNVRWERDTAYARTQLVNRVTTLGCGEGWVEERTGLHEEEFIETRRHRFEVPVTHDARTGVDVLNLVAGAAALVTSPDGAFEPFEVHYAETFVVPDAAGPYVISPLGGACATIKASVRT